MAKGKKRGQTTTTKRAPTSPSGMGGLNLPGGMGGLNLPGGMGGMMSQIQKLQEDMMSTQDGLKDEIIEASVGGGMVTVRMSAAQELKSIEINPEVVDPDEVEMLQDLLIAAFNEASVKAQAITEERMAPFTNMLNMGGLGGLF